MVATGGPRTGSRAHGSLALNLIPRDARPDPQPGGMAPVVSGTAEVALDSIGALLRGTLASADPKQPGVLVFERAGEGQRQILLRLGSEANRQDVQPFESGYTVMEVTEVREGSFYGTWRSGVTTTQADGYFCAARSGD